MLLKLKACLSQVEVTSYIHDSLFPFSRWPRFWETCRFGENAPNQIDELFELFQPFGQRRPLIMRQAALPPRGLVYADHEDVHFLRWRHVTDGAVGAVTVAAAPDVADRRHPGLVACGVPEAVIPLVLERAEEVLRHGVVATERDVGERPVQNAFLLPLNGCHFSSGAPSSSSCSIRCHVRRNRAVPRFRVVASWLSAEQRTSYHGVNPHAL